MTFLLKKIILEREEERGRGSGGERCTDRDIDLLFHLFMHSLIDSCLCPDGMGPATLV